MNYEKIKDQFGTWGPKLERFIDSPDFDDIFKFLKEESKAGKTICPESKNVFRCLRETPYEDLKVVFILQDPYPWIKKVEGVDKFVADGLAMSCGNTKEMQPSLKLFYDGMEDDLGYKVKREPDLTYLAKQGVLFLNSSLTVELNKPSSHSGKWDKFMTHLIDEGINFHNRGLAYVSFGKNAHVTAKAIVPFLHYGFEVEHPAAAAHKERAWDHQNIFTKINKILKDNMNGNIQWSSVPNSGPPRIAEVTSGIRGKVRK